MTIRRIRQLCHENNTTLAELERKTGIGNGVIARWENSSPRVENLKAVADYFGVTVDELLKEE